MTALDYRAGYAPLPTIEERKSTKEGLSPGSSRHNFAAAPCIL